MTTKATTPIYLIECRTGCSCCAIENHYRGPYRSPEDAQRRIDFFLDPSKGWCPVASQYARRGRYIIVPDEAEAISGDRYIVDKTVHDGPLNFVEVGADGSVQVADADEVFDRLCW